MQFSKFLLACATMASTVVAQINYGCIKTQPEYTALSE